MSINNAIERAQQSAPLVQLLERAWPRMAAVAPSGADPDRMLALWRSALLQDRTLLECSPRSALLAIREAVRLDLEPGGPLGQCWIVSYRDTRGGGRTAQLQLGYRGMITLAHRAGISIDAGPIYASDTVVYREGTDPVCQITPPWPLPEDRGELVGAYAIATMGDGRKRAKVIGYNDPETARARRASKSDGGRKPMKGSPPWEDAWLAKTAVRRLCQQLPQSPDLQRLAVAQDHAESGVIHNSPPVDNLWIDGELVEESGDAVE